MDADPQESSGEFAIDLRTVPDSTPDLVEPIIIMNGLGASVRLLRTQAELEGDDTTSIRGAALLRAHWDGRPLECVFESDDYYTDLPPINPVTLRIKDNDTGATASVQVNALSTELKSTLFGDIFAASLIPLENQIRVSYVDEDDLADEIVAHLLNVPEYNGTPIKGVALASTASLQLCARLRFTGGGWKITIDGLIPWVYQYAFARNYNEENPHDVEQLDLWRKRFDALAQFPRTGGMLITHAVRVERENGATFGLGRAQKILDRLGTFLSFSFGRRTRPFHIHGYRGLCGRKWAILDLRPPLPIFPIPHGTPPWLPQTGDGTNLGVDLSSAFNGFMSLAEDPGTLVILDRVIDWYSAALASFGSPASIVLAQAGLELLASRRISTEMKLSEKGRERLDATDQLRLLLAGTELPLDIPPGLPELSRGVFSGPEAVTKARNEAVHPTERPRLTKAQTVEAQAIAIWYLEMLLLRMMGHDGEYWDRLQKENRPVPWR